MDFGRLAQLLMPMAKKMADQGMGSTLTKSLEKCSQRLAAMEVVGEAAGGLVSSVQEISASLLSLNSRRYRCV
jgi:DNA-binding protein YbaB